MSVIKNLYYLYGNDSEVIEKKVIPDLEKKYAGAQFIRLDASIDQISSKKIISEFSMNDLFNTGKIIIIRNATDNKENVEALLSHFIKTPPSNGSALVLIAENLNAATVLGKLAKQNCSLGNFQLPEITPFDLLDALNCKSSVKVLQQSTKLFSNDYNPLALYSTLLNHFLLMKKVKSLQRLREDQIAHELKQHPYRIKKIMVANRYWSVSEIDRALSLSVDLGNLLRKWQYDERMLLEMYLINVCL